MAKSRIKAFHPNDPESAEDLAKECRDELEREISAASAWRAAASIASRYYRSDQYRRRRGTDSSRINMIVNYSRRDADRAVAPIIDAEPIIVPWGRQARNATFAKTLVKTLEWTRDEEEDYQADIEDGTTDAVHIGEAVWYEGWNAFADEGRGMPETKWHDSRYVYWDSQAHDWQRDDAAYIFLIEHVPTKTIQQQWEIEEEPAAESLELFLGQVHLNRLRQRLGEGVNLEGGASPDGVKRAWLIRRWKKQTTYDRRFFQAGEPAMLDGEPMGQDGYESLTADEQSQVVELSVPTTELWETVVVGKEALEHRLSPFDKSRGGHGHYPFGFGQGVRLRDEGRAYGEIGFLVGISDVRNETIGMLLDQAFLGNAGYMNVVAGSMSDEDEKKVPDIGRRYPLIIKTQMGMPAPHWEGINPAPSNVFSNLVPVLDSLQDRMEGHGPFDRNELINKEYSGRAIRALQAQADQLNIFLRRHIESGMKRITLLRLHNISQFMRGLRVAQITNAESGQDESIYIGDSEQEIVAGHQLQVAQDPQTGEKVYVGPDGKPGKILVLSDEASRDNILDRIRLRLDTDREANNLERVELSKEVLGMAGPGALAWYIKQNENALNDPDTLLADIAKYDSGQQIAAKLAEIAKRRGLSSQQALDMLDGAFQQTAQPALGGVPLLGQGGAVPQPGVPQGQPQAPGAPAMAMAAGG